MNSAAAYHMDENFVQVKVDTDPLTLTLAITKPGAPLSFMDHVFFFEDIDQILDLGYQIVAGCRKLLPAVPPIDEVEMLGPTMIAETLDRR